jgi:hypothetical protein
MNTLPALIAWIFAIIILLTAVTLRLAGVI